MSTNAVLYTGALLLFGLTLLTAIDTVTMYLSVEAISLLTYGLIATNKTVGSAEAGIKYYTYGVISSVIFAFGIAL